MHCADPACAKLREYIRKFAYLICVIYRVTFGYRYHGRFSMLGGICYIINYYRWHLALYSLLWPQCTESEHASDDVKSKNGKLEAKNKKMGAEMEKMRSLMDKQQEKLMEAREKNKRLQSELDEMRDELEDANEQDSEMSDLKQALSEEKAAKEVRTKHCAKCWTK